MPRYCVAPSPTSSSPSLVPMQSLTWTTDLQAIFRHRHMLKRKLLKSENHRNGWGKVFGKK